MKRFFIILLPLFLLLLFSCEPDGPAGGLTADFIPDLTAELPTSAPTVNRGINDQAVFAYFGGRPDGGMEWHSAVMLDGVRGLGEAVMAWLDQNGLNLPRDISTEAVVTLTDFEFMNASYSGGLTCRITLAASEPVTYLMEGFTADNVQVLRYMVETDAAGSGITGHFVWANVPEYTQPFNEASGTHVKEFVEVKYDLSDINAKELLVDTVQYHNSMGYYYGFSLRSTYNETAETGTGQYIDISPDQMSGEYTFVQNYIITYDLVAMTKSVAQIEGGVIINSGDFGSDNNLISDPGTIQIDDTGFSLLTIDSVPLPYTASAAECRITAAVSDWESYVNRNTLGF